MARFRVADRPLVVVIGGPTASGKSRTALWLARQWGGIPIVNADSRQFYREMTIGTAVPSPYARRLVPHYLFAHRSMEEGPPITVKDYEREALSLLQRLFAEHPAVIVVGGSGFFISALLHGLDEIPDVPDAVREHVQSLFQQQGLTFLQEEVSRLDPDYYARVDRQNPRRLQRALEVIYHTGKPFSSFHRRTPAKRFFRHVYVGVYRPPQQLRTRIHDRLITFWKRGLVEEARKALMTSSPLPRTTITYQELAPFFEGKIPLTQARALMERHTWQYARRQMTWFKKYGPSRWFQPAEKEALFRWLREAESSGEHGQ